MDKSEKRFEQDIESFLLSPAGGYTKGDLSTYDREKAIDMPKLIAYIKATQPNEWKRYNAIYGSDSENKLYKRIQESVQMHGMIHVIRHGIKDRGVTLKFASFRQANNLNPDVVEKYKANILTCTRQFMYSPDNNNSIDMVLSLNGFPLVALELKNQLTGQSVDNAKKQYMDDRDPKELCFQFDTRFLVYFAVDLYEVCMTTELKGRSTFFLPFNQGSNGAGNVGGAGNPENPDGYVTSYLWERVLQKDILMDILQRYIHRAEEEKINRKTGKKTVSRKIIFPRYHQLDAVTKLLADVKLNGAGKNYLIQHSAGSGKSNSIAWLAYGLSELHNYNDEKIFKSVIVITDRTVLDSQLQDTIYSFDHTEGVVEKIDEKKHSSDLRDAINAGKKIIITTLQKFPYIYKEIDSTKDKNFALIVDEAHSSQTGQSAMKLKAALADTEEVLKEFAEIEGKAESELKDEEDTLVEEMLAHGKHSNLSFFAFTATPKNKTLEMFGVPMANGKNFRAFHIYSMRQAIEEGFILDVLQNYMTYKTCYKIIKKTPDNPDVPENKATKAVQRYESLHPHNLQQKTAIIIETYRSVTKNKIGGKAKAMVVTASRLHAIRYYHEFKRYIEKKHYDDLDILVAFSGVIKDINELGEVEEYTEEKLNKRKDGTTIKENQLPEEFNGDDYAILIVAEKYQTGFDEPLLHTMFVDKKLKGVKAVQTLSRLNRTCAGKDDTFVLDFVNTAEEIQEAFEPYYEATMLDEEINPNLIYDTRKLIRDFKLYNDSDIEKFIQFFKKKNQSDTDLGKMTGVFKPIVKAYEDLPEDKRFDYKKTVRNFVKWYQYITQISRMFDMQLHEEYTFCKYLEKLLPKVSDGKDVNLDDKLELEFYKLEKEFKGSISLTPTEETQTLTNPKTLKTTGKGKDEHVALDYIIDKINDRYNGVFTDGDKVIVETIYNDVMKREKRLRAYAKKNEEAVFRQSIFPEVFEEVAQDCYTNSMEAFAKLFQDKVFYEIVLDSISRQAYKDLRNESSVVKNS